MLAQIKSMYQNANNAGTRSLRDGSAGWGRIIKISGGNARNSQRQRP
jgi:hypothetical protein